MSPSAVSQGQLLRDFHVGAHVRAQGAGVFGVLLTHLGQEAFSTQNIKGAVGITKIQCDGFAQFHMAADGFDAICEDATDHRIDQTTTEVGGITDTKL